MNSPGWPSLPGLPPEVGFSSPLGLGLRGAPTHPKLCRELRSVVCGLVGVYVSASASLGTPSPPSVATTMAERARRSLERDLERINHQADAPRITSPVGRPVHEEKNRAGRKGYKSILMQEFVPQGFEKEVPCLPHCYTNCRLSSSPACGLLTLSRAHLGSLTMLSLLEGETL